MPIEAVSLSDIVFSESWQNQASDSRDIGRYTHNQSLPAVVLPEYSALIESMLLGESKESITLTKDVGYSDKKATSLISVRIVWACDFQLTSH